MARFYAANGKYNNEEGYRFVGFDELGGEVVEATMASKLGMPMASTFERQFATMEPGEERMTASGVYLFRVH